MIVWLNGPFGAGKTTVAAELVRRDPRLAILDPESLGAAIALPPRPGQPGADFQDLRTWRRLVAVGLMELSGELPGDVVVPQSVLAEAIWREVIGPVTDAGVEVAAFTLHVDAAEHRRRIDADRLEPRAAAWRHARRADYDAALPWLTARTRVIDTTALTPEEVATAMAGP